MTEIHATNTVATGRKLAGPPESPTRLNTALMDLTHRRNSLHEVALELQSKLTPVLRNIDATEPVGKSGVSATEASADSSVVMIIDNESSALLRTQILLAELIQRLDV